MAGLGGLFSSIISVGRKILPSIQTATTSSSSASSSTAQADSGSGPAAEDDLRKLMQLLERIRATLLDAEEREVKDRAVKHWLDELKGVAYNAEDLVEEYQYEIHRAEVESRGEFFTMSSRKRKQMEGNGESVSNNSIKVPLPEGMVERIREVRNRFDEIAKDRDSLRLNEEDGPRSSEYLKYPLPTSHLINTSRVFGRQEEKEDVIRMICRGINGNMPLSVGCIFGTGGLGKTTVAQLVYNDEKIRENFDLFGWVCASDDFDVQRLTKSLFESITRNGTVLTELSAIQENLREKIKDKRVFVVLDDVWNLHRSHWELLQLPFMYAKNTSILVTTRFDKVAKLMQTMLPYRLNKLPEEDSWQLFQYYAFNNGNNNPNLVEIGMEIMKKCGGLPLAIKSLASLVRFESEEIWIDILQSDLWESGTNDDIFAPLQISYARLPAHLKPCFLFCSTFPKDCCFSTDQLVNLWISQGFVVSKGNKMLEEIGCEYVYDLRRRSFFDDAGKITYRSFFSENIESTFKLHDMIHDLARSISGKEHFSLDKSDSKNELSDKIYHLYATSQMGLVKPLLLGNLTDLRTLILHLNDEEQNGFLYEDPEFPSFDGDSISKAEKLRALEIKGHGCNLELTGSIGNLKYLRHLSLHNFKFETLPESICSLYNLQRLNIEECDKLTELPMDIGNLINLQFLSLQSTQIQKLPQSFCFLSKLKILRIMSCCLDELPEEIGNLIELRELILHEIEIEILPKSFSQITNLQKLGITYCYNFIGLPLDLGTLTNLRSIQTCYTKIEFLPTSLAKLTSIHNLYAVLEFSNSIGWLKEFNNLKEILCIEGLENITNMQDAQLADLKNKPNIKELFLSWISGTQDFMVSTSLLQISIQENDSNMLLDENNDIVLLENLQPNSNLQELTIDGFRGEIFPNWMQDPNLCGSLDKIWIDNCRNIKSISFGNLGSLKHLSIDSCHNLGFLNEDSLPIQLQYLAVKNCNQLVSLSGSRKLRFLIEFKIWNCPNLKAFLLDGIVLINLVALTNLNVYKCPKLRFMDDELVSSVSCSVKIAGCPRLRVWCLQHNIEYQRLEGEEEDITLPSSSLG